MIEADFEALDRLRSQRPLIHCISNIVTAADCANLLLAAGGRPVMAQEPAEMAEIAGAAQGCVLNTGTPDDGKFLACRLAGQAALAAGRPVVLDPVGAGASSYRCQKLTQLLEEVRPTLIRANLAEVQALLQEFAVQPTLCRLLQKNPRFYYQKRHFVSVSSLVYRMKRNGAGLASICILGTMVLVMISSTTCLYFGAEDSLRTRYPRAENVTVWYTDREDLYRDHSDLHAAVVTAARSRGAQMQDLREYRSSSSALTVRNGVLQGAGGSISDAVQFTAIPLSDYNAAMGARLTLSPGQVYICHGRSDYRESTLSFPGGAAWQVKGLVDNLASGGDSASVVTQLTAIVPDEEIADMDRLMEGMNTGVSRSWSCGFDLGQEPAWDEGDPVAAAIREALVSRQDDIRFNVESLSENRDDFYGSYGSLFFLGILLSVGFSLAAVLIIYYKQISEGYEDQARFDIMQKVGMTRRDIRSSINSQLLLVFFLPLLLAGLHLVFAFPFVHKLLLLFNLWNTRLLVGTTAASFLAFAVLYTLVYRATSTAYYHIVSDGGDR